MIKKALKYISLYFKFNLLYIKTQLMYPKDFIIWFIFGSFSTIINIFFMKVIYYNTPLLGNWDYYQTLMILGYSSTSIGLFNIFFINIFSLGSSYIVEGKLDKFLIRPINVLFQLLVERIDLDNISELIIGVFLIVYSALKLGYEINVFLILFSIVFIIFSVFTLLGLFLIFASTNFWLQEKINFIPILYSLFNFSRFPITIFNKKIKLILTFIMPYFYLGYYPVNFLLKIDTKYVYTIFYQPILCLIFLTIGGIVWKIGLSKYESTSI